MYVIISTHLSHKIDRLLLPIGRLYRLDSIDPALRRPGRFDREFMFPLPSADSRKQILQIHTSAWNPKLKEHFLEELAEKCIGYCGADLKALCTEAALHGLRRRYPQIYTSNDKLQLDTTSISVSARDFHQGMLSIIPAAQRSVTSPARALSRAVRPLMQQVLEASVQTLQKVFPAELAHLSGLDTPGEFPSIFRNVHQFTYLAFENFFCKFRLFDFTASRPDRNSFHDKVLSV